MSAELSWSVEREAGVSFVRCRVHNDADDPRRLRLRSRLDGPVLPPRRSGIPESGWDGAGVTLRLGPDERRGVGFASPAPPIDPPVEIDEVDVVADPDRGGIADAETDGPAAATAAAAIRDLGDHRPPRATTGPTDTAVPASDGVDEAIPVPDGADPLDDVDDPPDREDTATPEPEREGRDGTAEPSSPDGPDRVGDWLDAIERRVEHAERLTGADLGTATRAVDGLGGIDAVPDLERRVDADAARLRRVSERASSLAARAEATDVPRESLERLA
jgi:hypothetical protein